MDLQELISRGRFIFAGAPERLRTAVTKDGFTLYEKSPLARTIPISYFTGANKAALRPRAAVGTAAQKSNKVKRPQVLALPTETEILDMCKRGEDQTLEFKAAGTEVRKITKEIAPC